jgi:hypothetical protein
MKVRLMNVDLELKKFLLDYPSAYGVRKNGWGEPLRVEFGHYEMEKGFTVDKEMFIKFKGKKANVRIDGHGSGQLQLWGKNYKFITIYEEDGKIVVDTSRYLYMKNHREHGTYEEIIEQHNYARKCESLDAQIERLKQERRDLN